MNWNELALKYTQETLEFIKASKDVAVTQASLYIQELIKWEIYGNLAACLGCIVALILVVCVAVKLHKFANRIENDFDRQPVKVVVIVLSAVISFMFLVEAFEAGRASLKAYIAPRVVILEKLSNAVNSKK